MDDERHPPAQHQIDTRHVERAAWDDPDDTGRTGSYVRAVHGYRRTDPLAKVHAHSPGKITRRHIRAAEMLRDDWETANGAGHVDSCVRLATGGVSGGQGVGLAVRWERASRASRGAQDACGRCWDVVDHVVLRGCSPTAWGLDHGKNGHAAVERLSIGLDALADFYGVER